MLIIYIYRIKDELEIQQTIKQINDQREKADKV